MAAHLCVFACGLLGSPYFFIAACIVATFFSILSRSTHSAGVSSSHFETPGLVLSIAIARISAPVYPVARLGIHTYADAAAALVRKARRDDPDFVECISSLQSGVTSPRTPFPGTPGWRGRSRSF